jgi:hypothetical protein
MIGMTGSALAVPGTSPTPSTQAALPAPPVAFATPVPTPLSASSQKIDIPVPLGEPVKGIKIPQYDDQGKMTMCLTADTALKINEKQVELGKLKVQFSDDENKEIIVTIPHSILNLETKILTADSETLIHREDFEIVGQNVVFDTLSRQGTFKGPVHAWFVNGPSTNQP